MRVFVTGAAGQIGSQLVKELIAAGHEVIGLARSDANVEKLTQLGAKVHKGDLNDADSLVVGVKQADATVHLAFNHDFSQYEKAGEMDIAAIKAMLGASQGKSFVGTTGTLNIEVVPGRPSDENNLTSTEGFGGNRGVAERLVRDAAPGVKTAVVRLAPTVHFKEDIGFVPGFVALARKSGVSGYPGDGSSHWPAVHRDDAARLYKLIVEKLHDGTLQPGLSWNAVAESVTTKDIANTIAEKLGLGPAQPMPLEHFGFLGHPLACDNLVSNDITRKMTGWNPTGPTLFESIRDPDFAKPGTKTFLG